MIEHHGRARIVFVSLIILCLAACESPQVAPPKQQTYDHVYTAPFSRVWRAVQLSISTRYSLAVNQMETGSIETDWISSIDGYLAPYQKKPSSLGLRYRLILNLIKGKTADKNEAIRVIVRKELEKKSDFFSEPETQISDGTEEQSILYRVGRELVIEQAILKSQSQKPSGPPS